MTYRTKGLSPKLITAVLTPLSPAVYQLITLGTLDRPSLGLAAVAVLAGIGTYFAGPGDVEPTPKAMEDRVHKMKAAALIGHPPLKFDTTTDAGPAKAVPASVEEALYPTDLSPVEQREAAVKAQQASL